MKTKKSKARPPQQQELPPADITTALQSVSPEQWRQLAKLAEYLLGNLRDDPRLARYLAGVRGEEIVNSAVLAIQNGAQLPGNGRAVHGSHLENADSFVDHLKQIVRSVVSNFRRHSAGRIGHEPIGSEVDEVLLEPADSADLGKDLAIRDLLRVLLPRVFEDLRDRPKQLAVLRAWMESFGQDDILPAVQSKFLRYCVRQAVLKQLRRLAAQDLKVENPSGKELLF